MKIVTRDLPNLQRLVLCTGNSARSILAESILNKWGKGQFLGHSAGSHPTGRVSPLALTLPQQLGFPTKGLRSKSWDEFAARGAAKLDFVFTVCDPAAVMGDELTKMTAFREAFIFMVTRIKLFLSLPLASIDRMRLQDRLDAIGKTPPPGASE